MKAYTVHRDQAVWERETFYIEVPDEIPEDEHDEYLYEKLQDGVTRADYVEIQDSVEGMSTEITIERENENGQA